MRFHQSTTFESDELLHLLSAWRLSEPRRLFAYPTASRLELLLSSRVWKPGADVATWRDEFGQVVGFALLWSRSRETLSHALEGPFTDPTLPVDERILLEDAIVDWAKLRVQAMGVREGATGTLHTTVVQGSDREHAALERWKFQCSLTSANVYFTRQLASIPEGTLPDGFSIRPLSDARELPAYNALYSFNAVAHEHQLALLRSSEYAHLVATASDGALAAYCEVSVCRREWFPGSHALGGSIISALVTSIANVDWAMHYYWQASNSCECGGLNKLASLRCQRMMPPMRSMAQRDSLAQLMKMHTRGVRLTNVKQARMGVL